MSVHIVPSRSFIKIRERHRDIKRHSNNKVIINFGKPKFTITSYYITDGPLSQPV